MSTLMVSVSGIRGIVGNGFEPGTIVKYTTAFAEFCKPGKIVIGRDARISGQYVLNLVVGTLIAKGFDIINLGVCPTPTVLFNVKKLHAGGGIAITASHNPNEWNALKLLNSKGEFLSPDENKKLQNIFNAGNYKYNQWNKLGIVKEYPQGIDEHVNAVLSMKLSNTNIIQKKKFKVLLDCVNGAGSYIMPEFLSELGCKVIKHDCNKTGIFPRNPEPLPRNLRKAIDAVKKNKVDLGIVVDPDVDRLVLINEKGKPFGEENTIVQAVNFVLSKRKGNVVVNLSTTRAVDDIAGRYNCKVFRSCVGEANVVKKMKEVKAVIGGEGSGGVIYPALQYGRDALVGTVMILQQLAELNLTLSEYQNTLPRYYNSKNKINIESNDADIIIEKLKHKFKIEKINNEDGLRIDFGDHWVHFRKSNTEPIIRYIVETVSRQNLKKYTEVYQNIIGEVINT